MNLVDARLPGDAYGDCMRFSRELLMQSGGRAILRARIYRHMDMTGQELGLSLRPYRIVVFYVDRDPLGRMGLFIMGGDLTKFQKYKRYYRASGESEWLW